MYELIIKDFSNYDLVLKEAYRLNVIDFFVSNFGTIKISNDIENLSILSKKLNIKTIINQYNRDLDIKIPTIPANHIAIFSDKIEFDFKYTISIKDILSISVQPLIENNREKFYFTLKFITPNYFFWTKEELRFYSNTTIFNIHQNYEQNIKNLILFIKYFSQKTKLSPLIDMYLNDDIKAIRNFTTNFTNKKEFLWMKKLKIIDI